MRITEAELQALEAKDPADAGEDRWPVRDVQRYGAEVRRLRAALRAVLAISADRQAFVLMGPMAFAKAERIAQVALEAF